MSITIHIHYRGEHGAARAFAKEMTDLGFVDMIRSEAGNLRYEYYLPMNDLETALLIDSWQDQSALDRHHSSQIMTKIKELRDKYDLHMTVERFVSAEDQPKDRAFIRN